MKEAAGEANLTVVAIILIGVVAAVATPLVSKLLTTNSNRSCCETAGGKWSGNTCVDSGTGYYDEATYTACKS